MALLALPFGLVIGLMLGMLGGGGSVLALPVLVFVLGQGVHPATTASLIVVTSGALAGGLGHARGQRICWRHAGVFIAAALPGVVAGTSLAHASGARVLLGGFAGLMVVAAAATWRKAGADGPSAVAGRPTCPALRAWRAVAAGLAVGTLTGLFGVGGGFIIVPTLAIGLALAMPLAVGTSVAIISATSVMGLVAHLLSGGGLDVAVTAAMTAGCVAGALGGAAFTGLVAQRLIGRAFAALVVAVAAYLLVSTLLPGGPSAA